MKARIGIRKDTGEPFELDVVNYMLRSGLAIIGKRGTGKSYLIGLIAERLSELGQQFVIVDIMGQYYTLKQKYPIIVISTGNEDYADINNVTPDMAEEIAKVILESGQSVIIDISSSTMLEQYKFMASFFKHFYEMAREARRPIILIIDEIHRITPEKSMVRLKEVAKYQNQVTYWVAEIARTGRKHGVGYIVAGQREAETAKTSLTQCEVQINFKVTGIDYENLRRKINPEVAKEVKNLSVGEAVVIGFDEEFVIKVDERQTPHGGDIPEFKPVRVDVSEFVRILERIKSEKGRRVDRKEAGKLEKKIRELEKENEILRRRIVEYEEQLLELKKRVTELQEENDELREELNDKNKRIKALEDELSDASEIENTLEQIREASKGIIDAVTEFAEVVGIELYPSDISELIYTIKELEQRLEIYENTEREKQKLVEDALNSREIKHTVEEMKREIRSLLNATGSFPQVFKQAVRFDPETVFHADDITANVTESTIRSHLRWLAEKGILYETNIGGKKGYRNAFYAWVNNKLRKVKPTIPDEAVHRICEELKGIIYG